MNTETLVLLIKWKVGLMGEGLKESVLVGFYDGNLQLEPTRNMKDGDIVTLSNASEAAKVLKSRIKIHYHYHFNLGNRQIESIELTDLNINQFENQCFLTWKAIDNRRLIKLK